jgi:hypothetical protein
MVQTNRCLIDSHLIERSAMKLMIDPGSESSFLDSGSPNNISSGGFRQPVVSPCSSTTDIEMPTSPLHREYINWQLIG